MVGTGTPLANLAALAGIATSYEDVFGERHDASERTVSALLAALGFDVANDESTLRSLREAELRALERGLEPVYVAVAARECSVTIALADERRDAHLTWTLSCEDGRELHGAIAANALTLRETRHAGEARYDVREVSLGSELPEGYHRLSIVAGERTYRSTVIVAPASCHLPEIFGHQGVWGLAAQVYALRSERDWGAGDFEDLRALCAVVRNAGGAAVAVNPLHLLPRGASSPYGPSSRSYVNWAYLDITALPGHAPEDMPQEALARLRGRTLIDYPELYETKAAAARRAFDRFASTVASDRDEASAFAAFVRDGGKALRLAATFEVLAQRFRGELAEGDDWRTWPPPYRDPESPDVSAIAREAASDVAFYSYLQWQADVQLARVAAECHGMPLGLYRDLAVGTQLGGVDTWLSRGVLRHDVAVGAPPDLLNRAGQDWGVAPFDPLALRDAAYAPFAALLRANARHAGALRIDHVMGLLRLWWVPGGGPASDGAYVTYRLDELLGVLALESRRAHCLVVGEDLGTVPPGFRERLAAAGVLSYRVLQFEGDDEGFFPPEAYPELALVSTGTHDLPTMAAYWTGSDIDVRIAAGTLAAGETAQRERSERAHKRDLLHAALHDAGVPFSEDRSIGHAANRFLAKTPGRILMVQLEDVLGETEQINLPTTTDEHPNWRRRNGVAVEDLAANERFIALADALREGRGVFPGSA